MHNHSFNFKENILCSTGLVVHKVCFSLHWTSSGDVIVVTSLVALKFSPSLLRGCSSRRTVSAMAQHEVSLIWSWMTQMTGTTTLLSFTSRVNEAFTPLDLARTQRPG